MNIYEVVTNAIIEAIERDPANPVMPWHRSTVSMPTNPTTNKEYRGVNVINLWASSVIQDFSSNHWATYKQWQEADAQVRKGEKSTMIVFYKEIENEKEDTNRFVIRYSRVFNASQVEGFEEPSVPKSPPIERDRAVDELVRNSGIPVIEQGDRAFYSPKMDTVYVPESWRFFATKTATREQAYYGVLFHELIHATGHKSRLDRELKNRFGDPKYAFEELIAEIGSAFCCVKLGITPSTRKDHADYVANWLKALKDDTKAIFKASTLAQQATDYLL